MNAESFADYLAQPAKLYQLSYQEIKNLVAEYPFSANLRYLLLLKAKIEQDPKFEQYLHQYAAHGPDRAFLYELLHKRVSQLLDLGVEQDETLELFDLSTFKTKEAILVDAQPEEASPAASIALEVTTLSTSNGVVVGTINEDDLITDDEELLVELAEPIEEVPLVDPTTVSEEVELDIQLPTSDHLQDDNNEQEEHISEEVSVEERQPMPSKAFNFGENNFSRPVGQARFARLRRQNLRERANGAIAQVRKVAKESVAPQTDLASETLAILLERQGQYQEAIEMYERLSLLNPEKSRYFAAAIEKLKQKV